MQRAIVIMFIAMSLIPAGDSAGKIMTSQLGVRDILAAPFCTARYASAF